QSSAAAVLIAHQVRGGLAGGVGAGWPKRRKLIVSLVRVLPVAVDDPASHIQNPRPAARTQYEVIKATCSSQIARPGILHLPERSPRVGVAGQMVDLLRLDFAQNGLETRAVAQIAATQNDPLGQVPQLGRP